MIVTNENLFSQFWPQNCGDSLRVIEEFKEKKNYFLCEFIKYSYKIIACKYHILEGKVNNPQIEQVEFIDKIWPQNCGDSLKILEKTLIKDKNGWNKALFRCQFQKYPYEVIKSKGEILKLIVNNPLIQQKEFIEKEWIQKCGDILRVLEKTNKRNFDNKILFRCQFQKYPYEILETKNHIINGNVINPRIEIEEFVNKLWPQRCGDILKVLRKTNERKTKNSPFLWEVCFISYKEYTWKGVVEKDQILKGEVINLNLPWYNKESLIFFINQNFKNKKPTFEELSLKLKQVFDACSFNFCCSGLRQKIHEWNLLNYIDYYPVSSKEEENIKNYIQKFYKEQIETSNWDILNGKEIDIYLPKLRLGFEYNGNLWHSNHSKLGKLSNYHQEKSLLAQEKGIQLIHIWEWEWLNKQEIIKSLIKSKLGFFDKKIGARKCYIRELDYKTYAAFCNENHLQGEAGARVKLGLFYKGELIQVMSFGVPRFTDKYEWEIIRECSKLGYCIIGGKEKLWKYFIKNYKPNSILSYCDFSKFTGNSYIKLGFKKERLNSPGFVWYDNNLNQIFWRDPHHHQEMKSKYLKIYDAGQLVFSWKLN